MLYVVTKAKCGVIYIYDNFKTNEMSCAVTQLQYAVTKGQIWYTCNKFVKCGYYIPTS